MRFLSDKQKCKKTSTAFPSEDSSLCLPFLLLPTFSIVTISKPFPKKKTYKAEYKFNSCMQEPPVLSGEAKEGRV